MTSTQAATPAVVPTPTQSALIVVVPAAEAVVGPHRAVLDPAAGWGVPAHVTVLYPFLPPQRIGVEERRAVRAVVAAVPGFDVTFARVRWFGDTVLWVAPEPDEPFRRLTAALWQRFPQTPPYGGAHPDVTPHLTVGQDAPLPVLRRAAAAVQAKLPVRARVAAVRLVCGSAQPDSWYQLDEFALGAAPVGAAGA